MYRQIVGIVGSNVKIAMQVMEMSSRGARYVPANMEDRGTELEAQTRPETTAVSEVLVCGFDGNIALTHD